jgi:hypothetical protein
MSLHEAHQTLGHISYGAVKHAIKSGVINGIELDDTSDEVFCDACAQAKPHRKPFPQEARTRAKVFGERIHTDLWGPASVASLGGKWYSADFNDDATRWVETRFLAKKNESQEAYETFENEIETCDNARVKYLRSDRGTEFKNKNFDKHLARKGTKRELTVHDTHEQVGVAERMNRTKVELARAMLIDAKLPKFLWAEAMNHAVWIRNRAPCRALNGKTPFEVRYGRKPDLSNLVPFGTKAWVKIFSAGKLEPRSELGYFVGYDKESTGHRIYFPSKRTVKPEREVVFDTRRTPDVVPIPSGVQPVGENEKDRLDTHKNVEKVLQQPQIDTQNAPDSNSQQSVDDNPTNVEPADSPSRPS